MITISIASAANLSSNTHGVTAQISKGRQDLRPEVSNYVRAQALGRDFVNLRNLRPRLGADLGQLRDLVQAGGWRSALPEALPDPVLLMLALDFRSVEASFTCVGAGEGAISGCKAAEPSVG